MTIKDEDLFADDDNDNILLNIVFRRNNIDDPKWIIGYPILKHYMIERNFNQQMLPKIT